MEHDEVVKNNIIERYLLLDLGEEEENEFEQHLFVCKECRDELEMLEKIRRGVEKIEADKIFQKKKAKVKSLRYYLQIAAGIIFLFGLGIILRFIIQNEEGVDAKNEIIVSQVDSAGNSSMDSTKTRIIHSEKEQEKPIIASVYNKRNFKPNLFYENLVENQFRSVGVEIISPSSDTIYSQLLFEWKSNDIDSLYLLIIDNKENILLKQKISSKYIYPSKLDPGLYYWQLQSEEETVVTDKVVFM